MPNLHLNSFPANRLTLSAWLLSSLPTECIEYFLPHLQIKVSFSSRNLFRQHRPTPNVGKCAKAKMQICRHWRTHHLNRFKQQRNSLLVLLFGAYMWNLVSWLQWQKIAFLFLSYNQIELNSALFNSFTLDLIASHFLLLNNKFYFEAYLIPSFIPCLLYRVYEMIHFINKLATEGAFVCGSVHFVFIFICSWFSWYLPNAIKMKMILYDSKSNGEMSKLTLALRCSGKSFYRCFIALKATTHTHTHTNFSIKVGLFTKLKCGEIKCFVCVCVRVCWLLFLFTYSHYFSFYCWDVEQLMFVHSYGII